MFALVLGHVTDQEVPFVAVLSIVAFITGGVAFALGRRVSSDRSVDQDGPASP